MPPARLAIVLPAFNEASRLNPALNELFAFLDAAVETGAWGSIPSSVPREISVVVVDDGSTDDTAALVRSRPESRRSPGDPMAVLSVLTVPHGGKGAAVRAGMLASDAQCLLFADADMATPPDQIPLMVRAIETADVVLGSRIQPDGTDMRQSQPAYRRMLGRAFHLLVSIWVSGDIRDTQCGFKAFSRRAAGDIFRLQQITSIVFDVELIYLARRLGYETAVVPIQWNDRRGSRMRASPRLALIVALDLIRIRVLHRSVRRTLPGDAGERSG